MNITAAIHDLVVEIHQLNRLYLQLRNVPQPVQELFGLLDAARRKLIDAESRLARVHALVIFQQDVTPFKTFGPRLLDLEAFIDPRQLLHHSGPGSDARYTVPWDAANNEGTRVFCQGFRAHILDLDSNCDRLISALRLYVAFTERKFQYRRPLTFFFL